MLEFLLRWEISAKNHRDDISVANVQGKMAFRRVKVKFVESLGRLQKGGRKLPCSGHFGKRCS